MQEYKSFFMKRTNHKSREDLKLGWIDQCCGILNVSNSSEYWSDDYFIAEKVDEFNLDTQEYEINDEEDNPNYCRLLTFPPNNEDVDDEQVNETLSFSDLREEIKILVAEEESISSNPSYRFVLSHKIMVQIATKGLPPALFFSKWKRVYSLARDGDSFDTMLRLVKTEQRSLLVVKTNLGEIFGGFVTCPWTTESNGTFYGSGESILFKVTSPDQKDSNNNNTNVIAYKWSGLNHYIQCCESETKKICLGGGGTNSDFGLCIEGDLRRGSTGKCETFSNEPLTKDCREFFEIIDIEVWGFRPWTV